MMKPIAIIAHDDHLVEIDKEINSCVEHFKQRLEFLQKQMESIENESEKVSAPLFAKIIGYLISSKKMPPEFDQKKHHLHFHDGAILLCDGGHELFQKMTGRT